MSGISLNSELPSIILQLKYTESAFNRFWKKAEKHLLHVTFAGLALISAVAVNDGLQKKRQSDLDLQKFIKHSNEMVTPPVKTTVTPKKEISHYTLEKVITLEISKPATLNKKPEFHAKESIALPVDSALSTNKPEIENDSTSVKADSVSNFNGLIEENSNIIFKSKSDSTQSSALKKWIINWY